MPDWLSYDPLTGITTYFDMVDETIAIKREQDVEPVLDRAAEMRNTGATDDGIKREFWHYADLPPVVQMQLRQKGIDIFSKDATMIRRMMDEINANFPYCKVTHKTHR